MSFFGLKIDELFLDYAQNHSNKGNVVTHWVGIPLIIVGLFSMLSFLRITQVALFGEGISLSAALILLSFGIVFYCLLDWRLGMPFSVALVMLYCLGQKINLTSGVLLFVLGWVFQGIGHIVFEKKSPSFTKNLIHLFVGPLFIFSKCFRLILRGFH